MLFWNDVEPRFQGEWEISATFFTFSPACATFPFETNFFYVIFRDVECIAVAPSQQLRVDLVAVEVSSVVHVSHEISFPRCIRKRFENEAHPPDLHISTILVAIPTGTILVAMASGKYFGLTQLVGGFVNSFKERCACAPVDWCCVGLNATAESMMDGSYDLWLRSEQMPCLRKYEQKPLAGDINFNELDKLSKITSDPYIHNSVQEDVDDDADAEDIPLNSYFSSPKNDVPPSSSKKSRACRMRFGVRRGMKGMSRKLHNNQKNKRSVPNTIKLQDRQQASKYMYPSQELSRAPFLYPLKEEGSKSSADDDLSFGSSTARLT